MMISAAIIDYNSRLLNNSKKRNHQYYDGGRKVYSFVLLLLLFCLCMFSNGTHAQTQQQQQQQQPEIIGFTLFNSETDTELYELFDNDVIDLFVLNYVPLTIRADVIDINNEIDAVELDLDDGYSIRTESVPPYYLAGDSDTDIYTSNRLQQLGIHTLIATIIINNEEISSYEITFRVIDSSIETVPTSAPLNYNDVAAYEYDGYDGIVNGDMLIWSKVTIGFSAMPTSENNIVENPFLHYRLDVTFIHEITNKTYTVPGYYACDGNSANTGATSGTVWLVHFRPDEIGIWTYIANFIQGQYVAVNETASYESASFFDQASGSFNILPADDSIQLPDLRSRGRLEYVDEHYLKFAGDGTYFLKAGADSPENLLAYEDFDNTPNNGNYRKSYELHINDYNYDNEDPTWMNGKGRGIIGAINYLSSVGVNAISFLTMNINGDDKNVFPYSNNNDNYLQMDCSKLAQWDIVFDHAERKGMFLHFKTQETENDQLLDNGELGIERKLYYRELIARFGHHLALNWNIGEENTNTDTQRKEFIDYIKQLDPYKHPIVMHTYPGTYEENYAPLLGYSTFDGISLQSNIQSGYTNIVEWINRSSESGRKWIVAFDEQGPADVGVLPDEIDPTHDDIRSNVLWGTLMAGGWGVEYYFGYGYNHSDLTLQDFRSRDNMWKQSNHALTFFTEYVPTFWKMSNGNTLLLNNNTTNDNNWCIADIEDGITFVIYIPNGESTTSINLTDYPNTNNYTIKWFNPRNGGQLQDGSILSIIGGSEVSIGNTPNNPNQDWVALLTCDGCNADNASPTTTAPIPDATTPSLQPTSRPTTTTPPVMFTPTSRPTIMPSDIPSAEPIQMTDILPTNDAVVDSTPSPTMSPIMFTPTSSPATSETSTPSTKPSLQPFELMATAAPALVDSDPPTTIPSTPSPSSGNRDTPLPTFISGTEITFTPSFLPFTNVPSSNQPTPIGTATMTMKLSTTSPMATSDTNSPTQFVSGATNLSIPRIIILSAFTSITFIITLM